MDDLGTVTTDKLIINGQEYSPEDATQLIELGTKWRDTESKLDTSLDKVYPEYTKATQENKTLKEQLATEKAAREALENKPAPTAPNPDAEAVRRAAREVGLVDADYLKEKGFMTREEVQAELTNNQSKQKLVDNVLAKAGELEKTIDGSDGRVPFDSDAVLAFASTYQIDDLEEAYNKMNNKGNARWKEAQLAKEEKPGLTTLKGGGKKEPEPTKVTDDNFKEKWDELFPSNQE